MNRDEKKILKLTVASHSLVHLFEGVLPPLMPLLMANFGCDYFQMGIVVSIFAYAFGLGALPAGLLTDRIGPRRLVTLYLFGAGITAMLVLPVASLWAYGLFMGLLGAFCSTYHPAANTLISHCIRQKGTAFGIHGIAGSLGIAAVPILSAWIGALFGWRAPYLVYGLLAVGVGFFSLTLPRVAVSASRPKDKPSAPETVSARLPYMTLVLFFLSAMLLGLTYRGIMTFLPTYMGLKIQVGFVALDSVALGGTVATLVLLAGAAGQYASGRLTDRFAPEGLYLGSVALGTVCTFVMAASSGLVLVIAAALYAFFFFSTQPIQNYMITRYLPPHRHGTGYGIMFLMSFGVGSTAAAVSGYLADRYGLEIVFYVMGACFLSSAGLALVLFLRRNRT